MINQIWDNHKFCIKLESKNSVLLSKFFKNCLHNNYRKVVQILEIFVETSQSKFNDCGYVNYKNNWKEYIFRVIVKNTYPKQYKIF